MGFTPSVDPLLRVAGSREGRRSHGAIGRNAALINGEHFLEILLRM